MDPEVAAEFGDPIATFVVKLVAKLSGIGDYWEFGLELLVALFFLMLQWMIRRRGNGNNGIPQKSKTSESQKQSIYQ